MFNDNHVWWFYWLEKHFPWVINSKPWQTGFFDNGSFKCLRRGRLDPLCWLDEKGFLRGEPRWKEVCYRLPECAASSASLFCLLSPSFSCLTSRLLPPLHVLDTTTSMKSSNNIFPCFSQFRAIFENIISAYCVYFFPHHFKFKF